MRIRTAMFAAVLLCACLPTMAAEPATTPADVTITPLATLDSAMVHLTPSINYVLPAPVTQPKGDLAQLLATIATDAMTTAQAMPRAGTSLGAPAILIFLSPETYSRSTAPPLLEHERSRLDRTRASPLQRPPKYVST